jgi:hypothetical protein
MSKGILIFAHNNGEIDYLRLASICAKRIKKYLDKPVALVTNQHVKATEFDYIIETEIDTSNTRTLNNKIQPFFNTSRLNAFRLSPFNETIVIDVDYIVSSNLLNQFFESKESFLMASGVKNLHDSEMEYEMLGLKMKWATTLYFKKDKVAETIFKQAKLVEENYFYYKDLYRFNVSSFRNDYAFTIAEHIVKGLAKSESMPEINFLTLAQDEILSVSGNKFLCLVNNKPCLFNGVDLHFFNKQTILDFEEALS